VNLLIKEFVDGIRPPTPVTRTVTVGPSSGKRVLFLSSPIGLGHARRDLAVADALRELRPEVTVEWMTQHPVTAALGARGERVHPACDWLANESQHVESEAGEHDVHVFQALRSMDEILVANFMVFRDVLESEQYDLVVGDEAWDVDHFLHEHPQLKRAPFVWMTDFVGFLPMPDGGEREAFLTADYNAEMIEHVEGHPRVRDRSIFVGDPDDIVPEGFGQGLPSIREWTQAHYDFAGYVTGYDPVETADREALRAELGYGPDECVCLVTVGGSGVGGHLLGKVIDAYPEASDLVPGLRMVVVTGPRGPLPGRGNRGRGARRSPHRRGALSLRLAAATNDARASSSSTEFAIERAITLAAARCSAAASSCPAAVSASASRAWVSHATRGRSGSRLPSRARTSSSRAPSGSPATRRARPVSMAVSAAASRHPTGPAVASTGASRRSARSGSSIAIRTRAVAAYACAP
jgi:hypothetical protein